jgi:hypothetical protein
MSPVSDVNIMFDFYEIWFQCYAIGSRLTSYILIHYCYLLHVLRIWPFDRFHFRITSVIMNLFRHSVCAIKGHASDRVATVIAGIYH